MSYIRYNGYYYMLDLTKWDLSEYQGKTISTYPVEGTAPKGNLQEHLLKTKDPQIYCDHFLSKCHEPGFIMLYHNYDAACVTRYLKGESQGFAITESDIIASENKISDYLNIYFDKNGILELLQKATVDSSSNNNQNNQEETVVQNQDLTEEELASLSNVPFSFVLQWKGAWKVQDVNGGFGSGKGSSFRAAVIADGKILTDYSIEYDENLGSITKEDSGYLTLTSKENGESYIKITYNGQTQSYRWKN